MPNGDGGFGGFDFGGFFDSILSALASVIQAIIQFLQDLVVAIVQALNFLLGGIQETFGFSFKSLGEVWQGISKELDRLWRQVVLISLKRLWDLYQKIAAWARKLKAWLDRLHKLMRQYQIMALRRVINLIQRARQILLIFRLLHFKWAAKLDAWLSHVETLITTHVLRLESKINEIITWIDLWFDPKGLMKAFTLAQSLYRYVRGLRGVLGIPESRALTSDESAAQAQDRSMLTQQPHLEDAAVQRMLTSFDTEGKTYFT